jgi:hypothetical protein
MSELISEKKSEKTAISAIDETIGSDVSSRNPNGSLKDCPGVRVETRRSGMRVSPRNRVTEKSNGALSNQNHSSAIF